jgi:sn-glycerol 3-phosphate transport system substrate-binding protein
MGRGYAAKNRWGENSGMKRRSLLAGAPGLAAAQVGRPVLAQVAKTRIVWWHAMTGPLGDQVNAIVNGFNASQKAIDVEAVYKGGYADLMNATIAASRAGQAPHLVQIFEVGTENMIAAKKAVMQVWQLAKETGVEISPANYIPAVRGYYSLPDGRMASMPFNSSTAVMWINADLFRKAGLDPSKPPATWDEVTQAADTLKSKGAAEIPMNTSWFPWVMVEQYGAIHDIPYATKENGFAGVDAELEINSKPHVAIIDRLLQMAKDGTFKYGGRDNVPDPVFLAGQTGITFNSSAYLGSLKKSAQFGFVDAFLPYGPAIIKQPINSIIGGASLWAMMAPGRSKAEYKALSLFLRYVARPQVDATWAEKTGYVPVTLAGSMEMKLQDYFTKNPGTYLPIQQLERGVVTPNSRGVRLGRLPEIRNIISEEFEKALQGGVTAQQVMDNAAERGNEVLTQFARAVKA